MTVHLWRTRGTTDSRWPICSDLTIDWRAVASMTGHRRCQPARRQPFDINSQIALANPIAVTAFRTHACGTFCARPDIR
jgi:hypothetical protein